MNLLYKIKREQIIPISISEAWRFFSNPKNLKLITPENLNFRILTEELPQEIYPGLIIEYIVSPLLDININWVTEITALEKEKYFIDEQRFGPYKFWHHLHQFEKIADNQTKIIDVVNYLPPFGIFGRIANYFFIRDELKKIFDYREKAIEKLFNSNHS